MIERLQAVADLARRGGALALERFGRVEGRLKGNRTPVTDLDLEVERLMAAEIRRLYPGETVIGEETGRDGALDGRAWALDPIDGTAAYLSRLPHWGVSVGLLEAGEPVLGAVHLPVLGETYLAARGHGAWMESERWGRQRLQVSPRTEVDAETLVCAPSNVHRRYRVSYPGKIRCLGSTVAHVLLVARGDAVGAFGRVHLWDLAGCVPILLEAGGLFGSLSGPAVRLLELVPERDPVPPVLAATPGFFDRLRREVLRLDGGEPNET